MESLVNGIVVYALAPDPNQDPWGVGVAVSSFVANEMGEHDRTRADITPPNW